MPTPESPTQTPSIQTQSDGGVVTAYLNNGKLRVNIEQTAVEAVDRGYEGLSTGSNDFDEISVGSAYGDWAGYYRDSRKVEESHLRPDTKARMFRTLDECDLDRDGSFLTFSFPETVTPDQVTKRRRSMIQSFEDKFERVFTLTGVEKGTEKQGIHMHLILQGERQDGTMLTPFASRSADRRWMTGRWSDLNPEGVRSPTMIDLDLHRHIEYTLKYGSKDLGWSGFRLTGVRGLDHVRQSPTLKLDLTAPRWQSFVGSWSGNCWVVSVTFTRLVWRVTGDVPR